MCVWNTFFILRCHTKTRLDTVTKKDQECLQINGLCFYFIAGLLAVSIPQLDNFISLVGSISCTALAIIFPIFIHILTLTSEGDGRVPLFIFFKDGVIMVIGVFMFMFGTYTSVARIIERYKTGENWLLRWIGNCDQENNITLQKMNTDRNIRRVRDDV